jgi:hypothetical protein
MADNATNFSTLVEKAETYSKSSFELLQFNVIDITADAVSSMVSNLIMVSAFALSLLILNIGLALYIGSLTGNSFYGFFIIGGFYLLISFPLFLFRKKLIKYPISNLMIKRLLNKRISLN